MQPVRLITFDVFATLLERQSFLELGLLKPHADSRAVQHLARMAMTGCIGGDAAHLLDVQQSLGLAFDLPLATSSFAGGHDWDAMVHSVTQRLGVGKDEWLHVSALVDDDLRNAKERGVRTCFVPRPGLADGLAATEVAPELVCSDLWQLADQIAAANGAPVRYTVRAKARTANIAHDFAHWMRYEHGPDLLTVRGCQSFDVALVSETEIHCSYLFTNKAALDQYYAGPAKIMRDKGRSRFAEADMSFERAEATVLSGFGVRARSDWPRSR